MKSQNRLLIDGALMHLINLGERFSSRSRLSHRVARDTNLSERTVRRALTACPLVVQLLSSLDLGEYAQLSGETRSGCPPAVHELSSDVVNEPPEQTEPGNTARPHARPFQSPSGASPPSALPRSPLDSHTTSPASAVPSDAALSRPPLGGAPASRFSGRARRIVNAFAGECVSCGWMVVEGHGIIPVPYPDTEPTPLHCADCWHTFDTLDQAMTSTDEPTLFTDPDRKQTR